VFFSGIRVRLGRTLAWLTIEPLKVKLPLFIQSPLLGSWLCRSTIFVDSLRVACTWAGIHSIRQAPFPSLFLYAGLSDGQATASFLRFPLYGIVSGRIVDRHPGEQYLPMWIVFLFIHIYMSMLPLRYLELLPPLRARASIIIGQLILSLER
jgi:hypothetical protein